METDTPKINPKGPVADPKINANAFPAYTLSEVISITLSNIVNIIVVLFS
jgi:hypothetical protein